MRSGYRERTAAAGARQRYNAIGNFRVRLHSRLGSGRGSTPRRGSNHRLTLWHGEDGVEIIRNAVQHLGRCLSALVEARLRDEEAGPSARLLVARLRIKAQPDNVARFGDVGSHHTSRPRAGPVSHSS